MPETHPINSRWIRDSLTAIAVVAAVIGFGMVLDTHIPIEKWLFWKMAKPIACAALWLASCVVPGLAIVQAIVPGLPIRERLIQAAACGVYAFYLLQFIGGILGLFGPVWAIALPTTMLLAGAAASRDQLRRLWRRRATLRSSFFGASSFWQTAIVVFGIACLAWIYLSILTPRNAAFDAVWYHLGLGQGWAADGAILRSQEGWFAEALPNMAAVIYSWGFLLPTFDLFETAALAAQIEFLLFLMTLASIPVLVRWLVPRTAVGASWVALFLFPSVFIYDAGLHSGNDHIAAFWAVPIFLALRRAWTKLDWRSCLLLAVSAAGALMTKYQAISLIVGPAVFLVGRAGYLAIKAPGNRSWLTGPITTAIAGTVLTMPLWAKNWAWYGDPFFPALHRHMTLRPWHEDMSSLMEWNWQRLVRRPRGTLLEQLRQTFEAGWKFSFQSYTAGRFHGAMPYFGSLFTLSALWLPFVRGTKRTWALFVATQLGVFTWFAFSHVERYLQLLVPWMASVVAAALILAWRQGWVARVPLVTLVAMQVIWGGDAPFIRSHAMLHELPMIDSARLIRSGYKQDWARRERVFDPLQKIGEALPSGSTALLHELNPRLGLSARVVGDMPGLQSGIRYGLLGSPQDVDRLYRDLGVTHVVWARKKSYGFDSLAGDLRFFEFVNTIKRPKVAGSFNYGEMPKEPPSFQSSNIVLYAGCGSTFQPGLHRLGDMNVQESRAAKVSAFRTLPADDVARAEIMRDVDFVVYGPKCRNRHRPALDDFTMMATRKGEQLWVRKR
jgi:hypothetical protein